MKPEILPLETMLMGIPKDIALEEKEQQLVVLTNENHTEGAATMFYSWNFK